MQLLNMFRFLVFIAVSLYPFITLASPQTFTKIVQCLTTSGIPQAHPGTSSFSQLIIPLNLRLNYTPIALALPTTVPQVQAAVKCAAKLGVKVNPRSGGHSYASHSIGGEDGHLVIDLRHFRETVLDKKTNVATVGPGARLGNVAVALYKQGGRAMAHGICPGCVHQPLFLSLLTKQTFEARKSFVNIAPTASASAGMSSTAVKVTAPTPTVSSWISSSRPRSYSPTDPS